MIFCKYLLLMSREVPSQTTLPSHLCHTSHDKHHHEINLGFKGTWQQQQEAVWCLLRERRCPRCCKICTEEAPDKQYLRSWNEGGVVMRMMRGRMRMMVSMRIRIGYVCKDLEQGDPGVLELLGHYFASMVPLSKSVDCPLFFSLFKFVFS